MPQKYTPALKVRAVACTLPYAQTAPTFRPGLRAGVSCCHAFCFGCVIPHGSYLCPANPPRSVVLHYTALCFVRSLRARSFRLGYLLKFLFEVKWSFTDTLKLHSLPTQGSLRSIPFHSVLFHSVSLQSTRCPCCARLRCRSGCGLSCFLHPDLLADARPAPFNNQPHKSKKSRHPLCSPAFYNARADTRPTYIVRSRFLRKLSLLTPYLLLAGFIPLRSIHPWAARNSTETHRTADAQ